MSPIVPIDSLNIRREDETGTLCLQKEEELNHLRDGLIPLAYMFRIYSFTPFERVWV